MINIIQAFSDRICAPLVSDVEVAAGLHDSERVGVDTLGIEPVGDELSFLERFTFVLGADSTPQLRFVGTVVVALSLDGEHEEFFTVVLDDGVPPDPGVATDDELSHTLGLPESPAKRFDFSQRRRWQAGPTHRPTPPATGRRSLESGRRGH